MQIKLNLFVEAMQDAPVIAAVKNDEGLDRALSSGCTVVFLLYGTILNIGDAESWSGGSRRPESWPLSTST